MARRNPTPSVLAALSALAVLLAACGDARPGRTSPPAAAQASPPRATGAPAACRNPGAGPEPDGRGVRSFVTRNLGAIRDCYDRALKRNPELAGKAVLRFTVGPCGQVTEVEVDSRAGEVREAASCVERLARSWRTPFRPAEPVAIEFPLAFSAM